MQARVQAPMEEFEQRALAAWLDSRRVGGERVLWTHPPNGGKRGKATAAKLKREGVKAGVPDALIFTPPPAHPGARGVALELKRQRGGRVSDEQEEWLGRLAALGWVTLVCKGATAAQKALQELGY